MNYKQKIQYNEGMRQNPVFKEDVLTVHEKLFPGEHLSVDTEEEDKKDDKNKKLEEIIEALSIRELFE